MDYKRIIKSRSLRLKILNFLRFVPDKPMIKLQYRIKTGRKLNLNNPKRFTEKLQWYKLYYKNPLMVRCVDKYDVRGYVKKKGLGKYLNTCYGVYDNIDKVDWKSLPKEFVMKDTLGGGGIAVAIIKDKNKEDVINIGSKMIKPKCKGAGREWPYYYGKDHRLIIEKLIKSDNDSEGLIDYKFFCFNGKVEFLYVMADRKIGQSVKVSIYNRSFRRLPVKRVGDAPAIGVKKPINFEEMITVAEKLSADFPHVRVDLYNVDGRIIFGELTFFNASGYMLYDPDTFDFEIGRKWIT